MLFESNLEFRKLEKRKSKNGNVYNFIKFEDDNGDILGLYCPNDLVYTVEPSILKKGDIVRTSLEYRFNPFEKSWRMELCDILGYSD